MRDGPAGAPLRVLVVLGNAITGGMETAVLRLAERLPRGAFRLTVLAPFASPFTERLAPHVASLHVAPMHEKLRWHTIQRAVQMVQRERIDVIHAHLWNAHPLAAIVGRVTATPVLATVHGVHLTMLDLEAHRLGGTHVSVVSDAAHAHALALGIAAERITCIRNGVDMQRFAPRARAARGGVAIGYVGRLSPEKNPQLFLRAAARARVRAPHARFAVVGTGPLREELAALARTLALDDIVAFAGEHGDMPAVYGDLDVLALTSHEEGTPLVVLEAMASGLPVIATAVGGVPELVSVGHTGLLVPPGDEIALAEAFVTLAGDAAQRARLGAAARARAVRDFSLDHTIAATGRLLRAVAGATPVRPRELASPRPRLNATG